MFSNNQTHRLYAVNTNIFIQRPASHKQRERRFSVPTKATYYPSFDKLKVNLLNGFMATLSVCDKTQVISIFIPQMYHQFLPLPL